ncbi:type II toxin-antitoxin system HicB family antitoxin [Enterovirga sp. CN4-39]|uniref:type II toxin-antitoxin system HicB family antitoxin n=1 Tax=Enterovirga sp. CN4-39 TaxID=3400910 RepID=UPI003C09A4A1
MTNYIGILEKEPTSLWGIWFPDLPGCVTAAEDAETCIAQASEALELWVEDAIASGQALPPARTLDILRQDPDVAEALAKGDAAVLVALPIQDLGFDRSTWKQLDTRAAERGLTPLAFVRETVLEKLAS